MTKKDLKIVEQNLNSIIGSCRLGGYEIDHIHEILEHIKLQNITIIHEEITILLETSDRLGNYETSVLNECIELLEK